MLAPPDLNDETRWQACLARDARFDTLFYQAVKTTGVFCKPSCPGRPLRKNVIFFDQPDDAIAAGFRACKRCRPLG